MRRVLVTGASSALGRRVSARLMSREDVETVIGVDAPGGMLERGGGSLSELIDDRLVDTVIHAGMCPGRNGAGRAGAPDVIATQRLTAAMSGRRGSVRAVVAVSSTEVYPARSSAPLWRREDEALQPRDGSDAALILEAEAYLRDLAERQPHISVAILRLADLVGPAISSPLAQLWQGPLLPFVAGYDPSIQVVHVDDATSAIEHAAAHELAGTFNVAGTGVVRWRRVARVLGRPAVPAPVVPDAMAPALARSRAPHVPLGLADVLRFGRCADTTPPGGDGVRARALVRIGDSRHDACGRPPSMTPTWVATVSNADPGRDSLASETTASQNGHDSRRRGDGVGWSPSDRGASEPGCVRPAVAPVSQ